LEHGSHRTRLVAHIIERNIDRRCRRNRRHQRTAGDECRRRHGREGGLVKRVAHMLFALLFIVSVTSSAAEAEFPAVVPGYTIELPRDEGSHPQFRTEWWYLTGWVEGENGEQLGFQLTFFRNRPGIDEDNPSRFVARQVLFAHAAVSDQRRGEL